MRIGIVCLLLLIAGCASSPEPAPAHAPAVVFKLQTAPAGAAFGINVDPDGTLVCPDGRPILSGYITDQDLAAPDAVASWIPEPPIDWDTYYDKRRENVDQLRANARQTITLQAHAKDVLVAARRGRFCEATDE